MNYVEITEAVVRNELGFVFPRNCKEVAKMRKRRIRIGTHPESNGFIYIRMIGDASRNGNGVAK
ncbi:MAG: hypothetical protein WCV59_04290 [Parcubacteria group bacterium]|jgi:hypothetical protein